ncbi:hypothetical protein F4824DRAFT_206919 [Ustulina deusta]|nr:hypothetical protein F4824DRAFT_206919 [Ustulina deusta]
MSRRPIWQGSPTESDSEYARTPSPTQLLLEAPPHPPSSVINEKINHNLIRKKPPRRLVEEIGNFFTSKCPIRCRHCGDRTGETKIILDYSPSILHIDEEWVIRLPHPLYQRNPGPHYNDLTKTVYAHHFQIKFMPGGLEVEEWGNIAKEFRRCILSKHDLLDAAVEFTMVSGSGTISAWYPPEVDKDELRSFFGDDHSDNLDLEAEGRGHGREVILMSRLEVDDDDDLDTEYSDTRSRHRKY